MEHQIRFPHLGIVLKNVGDGVNIGGFEIKYYGMIIETEPSAINATSLIEDNSVRIVC